MNKIFLILTIFLWQSTNAMTWNDLFSEKKELLKANSALSLIKQLQAFQQGDAPIIVDPRIKAIPIEENHESLIDIRTANHSRIFMLPNPEKPFASPDCSSGFACASMVRAGLFEKLKIMVQRLDFLAKDFGYEPGDVSIGVFEALRDVRTQENLFQTKRAEIEAASPTLSDIELDLETAKWVSPTKNNVPVHATGGAIDMRLMAKGKFIDMGKFGAIWGANPTAPTFSEDITLEQKLNRLYLLLAANSAELTNYVYEFWHYSSKDRYHLYWQETEYPKIALYGSVNL
jgi:D-alanyl-D-alanine dipeptidase